MRTVLLTIAMAFALCTLTPPADAADDFKDLLARVPSTANAIVLIDVEGLMKSPRGMKERWASKHESEYLNGALMVPTSASKAVLASRIGGGHTDGDWVVGIIPTKRPINMAGLAKDEKGELDTLAETPVVRSKRNAYFVQLEPKLLGVMSPSDRQEVGRWIRDTKRRRESGLSSYLQDAAGWPRDGQVLLAIDMQDMLNPTAVRNWLTHCKQLEGKRGDIDKAAKLLGSLRGLKFMARVTDSIKAQIYLDFADNLDPKDAPVLKPVLIAGLEEFGASLEDFTDRKPSIEGRSLIIEAEITDKVLRRILSVIHAPAPSAGVVADTAPANDEDPVLSASRRYYKSVQSLVKELKDQANASAYSSSLVIKWYETFARKIDQLPLLNVDPELLQYGSSVANKLRQVAASFQGQVIQTGLLRSYTQSGVWASGGSYYGSGYYGGGYGYSPGGVWASSNSGAVHAAQTEASAKGRTDRNTIWQSIDADTAECRKSMVLKFKTDFDA